LLVVAEAKICATADLWQAPIDAGGNEGRIEHPTSNTQHPLEAHEQGPLNVPKQEIHIPVFR
jgi:hypothetical protein